ncbi:MAG: FmdB family zinc ribbon protein [Pirellulales bacterium]
MPTYDYECDACGHKFEHFQSINDPLLRKCPQCKKQKLRRLFGTGAAVMFKGSGFYQTDYRSDSYKKAASADSAKSDGAKGEGSKSESKSDKASESKASTPAKSDSGGKSSGKKSKDA